MKFILFGNRCHLVSYSYISKKLWTTYGIYCEFWTTGYYDAKLAEKTMAFSGVRNFLPYYNFQHVTDAQHLENLKWLREVEKRSDEIFVHRDISLDRYFQGGTMPEAKLSALPFVWNEKAVTGFLSLFGQAVEKHLLSENIAGIFVESNSAPYRIVRRLCLLNEIPSFTFMPARLWEGRGYIEYNMDLLWQSCRKLYKINKNKACDEKIWSRAEEQYCAIRDNKQQPHSHMTSPEGPPPLAERIGLRRILKNQQDWFWSLKENWHTNPRHLPPKISSPLNRLARYFRTQRGFHYYRRLCANKFDLSRPYAVYFLQVQPELTVEAMAFEYQDQVSTIRNLVSYLSANVPLLVKEHKPTAGRRPIEFYAELAHIPNVILIEGIHSHDLIKNASVVLTLTGTVALEAMIYGTPALVLGEVFFNQFDGIYHPRSWDEMRKLLSDPDKLQGATHEDAIRMLAALYEASVQGIYPPRPHEEPELSAGMVKALYQAFSNRDNKLELALRGGTAKS